MYLTFLAFVTIREKQNEWVQEILIQGNNQLLVVALKSLFFFSFLFVPFGWKEKGEIAQLSFKWAGVCSCRDARLWGDQSPSRCTFTHFLIYRKRRAAAAGCLRGGSSAGATLAFFFTRRPSVSSLTHIGFRCTSWWQYRVLCALLKVAVIV